jgi:hypothetical protein
MVLVQLGGCTNQEVVEAVLESHRALLLGVAAGTRRGCGCYGPPVKGVLNDGIAWWRPAAGG